MRRLLAITVVAGLVGCGRTLTVYYRTSPRSVEVTKHVTATAPFARAVRSDTGALEIHVKRASRVTLTRVLHYNATAIIYDHSRSLAIEAGELLLGLITVMLPSMTWGYTAGLDGPDNPDRKVVRRRGFAAGLFDPTTSVLMNRTRIEPVVREPVFRDPPVVRSYEIRVPDARVTVDFRVLDLVGDELVRGSATTDAHGALRIESAPPDAVAVELVISGRVLTLPVEPTRVADAEPAVLPRVRTTAPLINDGWAGQRRAPLALPRVTLALDVLRVIHGDVALSAEVRVERTQSLGGRIVRETLSADPVVGESRGRAFSAIGGFARYYVFGHAATGIQLGLEAMYGVAETGSRRMTSYGWMLGGKYSFASGPSFELVASQRWLGFTGGLMPARSGWAWQPELRASVGWSL